MDSSSFRTDFSFTGQGYSNYGRTYPGFTLPQQQMHGTPHRASYPDNHGRSTMPQDDSMDFSHLEYEARSNVNDITIQDVIKPEQAQPWVGAQANNASAIQQQQWQQSSWVPHAYARSEPLRKQDGVSESTDSGYQSQLATAGPTFPNNYTWNRNELEQSYCQQSYPNNGIDDSSVASDNHPGYLSRDNRRKQLLPACRYCNRAPKNPSDAKKHELTHTKPFRCLEPDCHRKEGFATDNDLQRHRKSVHHLHPKVGSTTGYMCVACPPADGSGRKYWPRRDNFKAHIKRKHPNADVESILEASKQPVRPDDAVTVNTNVESVAPHSQFDPDDQQHYQMDMSPGLSRHPSDQGNHSGGSWIDSGIEMSNTEDTLVGMHGHTANLQYPGLIPSPNIDGFNLPQIVNDPNYSGCAYPASSFKKPKLNHQSYQQRQEQLPQIHHLTIPSQEHRHSSSSSSSLSAATVSPAQGEFTCDYCQKVKKRDCDLKKHIKRHTRPYGCTFPNCQKRFGSRNDWKRHESSQHLLREMWKCEATRVDGTRCSRRPFQHVEKLEKHLRGIDHEMHNEEEIKQACCNFRLGREGHDHYWCGFCEQLVAQEEGVQNAWDARFKHIGDHFDKDNYEGGDWVCIEENKKKKYITPDERKDAKRRTRSNHHEEEEMDLPTWNPNMNVGGYSVSVPNSGTLTASNGYGREMRWPSPGKHKLEEDDADGMSDS